MDLQQFREMAGHHPYRSWIQDRDSVFANAVDKDKAVKGFGVHVLKTPVRAPKPTPIAND
jgi:hypothetical protein